jgi:hypothetical protein
MSTPPDDDSEWGPFAKGHAGCPICGQHVPIPVEARLFFDEEGRQRIETRAEMAELWSHMWTHETAPTGS